MFLNYGTHSFPVRLRKPSSSISLIILSANIGKLPTDTQKTIFTISYYISRATFTGKRNNG